MVAVMSSAKALLGAVAGRFLFRAATVTAVERIGRAFVHVHVEGDDLRGAPFVPGDKVQIFLPRIGMRTYTPLGWQGHATSFVAFLHGDGPGAAHFQAARAGHGWQLFGPRRSIDTRAVDGPLVVAGDETSIGVAVASARARPGREVSVVLEAADVDDTRGAVTALGLDRVAVVERGAAASPLAALVERGAAPVFTGRAATIQVLQRDLRARGLRHRGPTKAYWAEGKRGLD